jgi:ABC-type glycerol-3-phosphate transport system permease component
MNKNTKITIYVVVAIVVLMIITLIVVSSNKNKSVTQKQLPPAKVVNVQSVDAQKGQIVDGFPQAAVEKGNTIDSSFKFSEGTGTSSYHTNFTSSKSVQDEYNYYTSFLKSQKLSVSSEKYTPELASIFAYDSSQNVNVTITKQPKSTSILIVYTK